MGFFNNARQVNQIPQPIQGDPRMWSPTAMPDVPYMPAVQMPQDPVAIPRYVSPDTVEGQAIQARNAQPSVGPARSNLLRRIFDAMAAQGRARNPQLGVLARLIEQIRQRQQQQQQVAQLPGQIHQMPMQGPGQQPIPVTPPQFMQQPPANFGMTGGGYGV